MTAWNSGFARDLPLFAVKSTFVAIFLAFRTLEANFYPSQVVTLAELWTAAGLSLWRRPPRFVLTKVGPKGCIIKGSAVDGHGSSLDDTEAPSNRAFNGPSRSHPSPTVCQSPYLVGRMGSKNNTR